MRKGLRRPAKEPRAWQRMLSGRRLDLLDPSPMDIEIADIAHGLARVARWNGQTVGEHAFSVAGNRRSSYAEIPEHSSRRSTFTSRTPERGLSRRNDARTH